MNMRIMFAGGGTGGHIYPLEAIAEELKNVAPDVNVRFIGNDETGISKWRLKLPFGIPQAFFKVWAYIPDTIITTGGYAAFLPLLAGKFFFIPIIVCDLDSVAGLVNHFFGRRARQVFVAYEQLAMEYPPGRVTVVGYPIRRAVLQQFDQAESVKWFCFDGSKPVVFITTANQGSQPINDAILLAIVELTKQYHIIHQAGSKQFDAMDKGVKQIIKEEHSSIGQAIERNYKVFSVMSAPEMALAYSACDIVMSRAGTVLFEIAAAGKPAVVIPLDGSAGDHQEGNAREFANFGGIVIEQANLTEHVLLREITLALENKEELGKKIAGFAKPNAALAVVQTILPYLS